ncbi:MAG: hypothetical protein ACPIOQ_66615 [Promethearchaeia archaeon]
MSTLLADGSFEQPVRTLQVPLRREYLILQRNHGGHPSPGVESVLQSMMIQSQECARKRVGLAMLRQQCSCGYVLFQLGDGLEDEGVAA